MQTLDNALVFIVGAIFDFYIYVLLFCFLLQKIRANYYNPVSQFVLILTQPLVKPLRRILPRFCGHGSAIFVLVIFFELIKLYAIIYFSSGHLVPNWGIGIWALAEIINKIINIFFFAVIICALMSWIPRLQQSPIAAVVILLTAPLTNKVRRFIPSIAGFDLSPLIIIVILQLISLVLVNPLMRLGMGLVF